MADLARALRMIEEIKRDMGRYGVTQDEYDDLAEELHVWEEVAGTGPVELVLDTAAGQAGSLGDI